MTPSQSRAIAPGEVNANRTATTTAPAPASPTRLGNLWVWACRLGLAALPLVLALGFYYRPLLRGEVTTLPTGSDSDQYIYQTWRMGELGGRWWKLGYDELVGHPYPTKLAKHPGLYEGLDLLLVSTVTSHFLSPRANYHLLVVLELVINGWVAAWIVLRLTRSYGWAALAVVLITLNMSVDGRVAGNLHTFKYSWILLTVWAFSRYLDAPSLGRGVLLGLAAAVLLLSSFYFGFLLLLSLGIWWLGCLVSRSVQRQHLAATLAAGLTFTLLATALTFPVWRASFRKNPQAQEYFQRSRQELWLFSSEPWQYVVSPHSDYAKKLLRSEWGEGAHFEGWNYPGLVVLLAIGGYVVARLRGWQLSETDPRFLDRLMGLSAVLVVLSLWGGPAVLIYDLIPFFRCYGRAGLIAVGLWCIAAPIILHGLIHQLRWLPVRVALLGGLLLWAFYEGNQHCKQLFLYRRRQPDPAWVAWLAQQPADVRLVVFPLEHDPQKNPEDWLNHWYFLYLRTVHKHATLNGCDPALLQQDLEQQGSSRDHLSHETLRFLVSSGYNALAFRRDYLQSNPWIEDVPELEPAQVLDDWHIFRVGKLPAYPAMREVSVPVKPVAENQMTWKDGVGHGWGDDSFLVFALDKPQWVYGIRLKYAYPNPAAAALFQMLWKNGERSPFVPEQSYSGYLASAAEERTLTVWIYDTIDHFRVDPDIKPGVFKLSEIVLLVPATAQ